jgi:hypothetical protein
MTSTCGDTQVVLRRRVRPAIDGDSSNAAFYQMRPVC